MFDTRGKAPNGERPDSTGDQSPKQWHAYPHPDTIGNERVPPIHPGWHALPVASLALLIVYALIHPNCFRWFDASSGSSFYLHALLVAFFTAMVYFGDLFFRFRYKRVVERRAAGRISGTALLVIWDVVILFYILS